MMKVLHVSPYMHPAAGGPPVVVERYCQYLPGYGWNARVLTTSLLCEDDGSNLQRALSERIEAEVLPVDRPRVMGLSSRARNAIDAAVRASDIVHAHTLWHPLGAMVRRAARAHNRPYVTMPHGMLDTYSLSVNARRKRLYLHLVERANLEGAQRIVYTSEEEKRLATEAFPWLPPGVVTPLGADNPPNVARAELRQAFLKRFPKTEAGRRCLLFLGRLHPKKGLDSLLDVLPALARQFPNVFLIVAGAGDQGYTDALLSRAQVRSLRDRVLFTGSLDGEVKWGAFAVAEAFVLPSRQENFAIAVAEAMRMGLPVVISDRVNTWPDILEANAGLVAKGEDMPGSLLEALTLLLGDPEAARAMGRAGRTFADATLTWDAAIKGIIACYENALGSSESKASDPSQNIGLT